MRGFVLAALVASALALPASSQASTIVTYVALGDSYASGEGLAPFVSSTLASCDRSPLSYPYLSAALEGVAAGSFLDASCAGARLSDLGVATGGAAPQLSALRRGVDVVSLQAGGNDAFFSELSASCLNTSAPTSSASIGQVACDYWVLTAERLLGVTTGHRAIFASTLRARYRSVLESRLLTTIVKIRDLQGRRDLTTGSPTTLAVLDYPLLLPALAPGSPACVLGPGFSYAPWNARTLRALNVLLDHEIELATARYATKHHDRCN